MPLPHKVTREHVLKAIEWIDKNPRGVPKRRRIKKFALRHNQKSYPPKFAICKANEFLTGVEFDNVFGGGTQANNFLIKRKFEIWDISGKEPERIDLQAVKEDVEDVFREGGVLREFREHKRIERDTRVATAAKQLRLGKDALLRCDTCGFSFAEVYGDIGDGFVEAHHKLPLSGLKSARVTKLSDIALVCSNCHSMIHQCDPLLTIEELKEIIEAHKTR
jgi:HNH endonuclease